MASVIESRFAVNEGLIERHRLTLGAEGLRGESEGGSQVTAYSAIEHVPETEERADVYPSSVRAHVIHRPRLQSGDLPRFIGALPERGPGLAAEHVP